MRQNVNWCTFIWRYHEKSVISRIQDNILMKHLLN